MNIYDFEANDYLGNLVSLKQYEGKVILVVNTATKCGFTPQYEGLEAYMKNMKKTVLLSLTFHAINSLLKHQVQVKISTVRVFYDLAPSSHNLTKSKSMVMMHTHYSFG